MSQSKNVSKQKCLRVEMYQSRPKYLLSRNVFLSLNVSDSKCLSFKASHIRNISKDTRQNAQFQSVILARKFKICVSCRKSIIFFHGHQFWKKAFIILRGASLNSTELPLPFGSRDILQQRNEIIGLCLLFLVLKISLFELGRNFSACGKKFPRITQPIMMCKY